VYATIVLTNQEKQLVGSTKDKMVGKPPRQNSLDIAQIAVTKSCV